MNPIRDYNNELFRYPSSKRGINISQELEKFDSTKVGEILNDIKKIHILFISIRGLTNSTKLGHPNPGSWS